MRGGRGWGGGRKSEGGGGRREQLAGIGHTLMPDPSPP
jgi:hypothetical protein